MNSNERLNSKPSGSKSSSLNVVVVDVVVVELDVELISEVVDGDEDSVSENQ